jgi:NADH-quinone oxidoreductase subunit C
MTGGEIDQTEGVAETVDAGNWAGTVRQARDEGFGFFDCLSVTDGGDGSFGVRLHLWDRSARRHRHLATTVLTGDEATLDSVADVFAGAGWHEREAAEMFGLRFRNAPDERPLLLADGFVGHPLRKDFALASRAVQEWPGVHEPSEHGPAARPPGRRRPSAPGVPDFAAVPETGGAE